MNNQEKQEIRKKQIIFLVQLYYDKFEILHDDDLDSLIQKTLDIFFNTDLTIDEINEELMKIVLKKSDNLKKQTAIKDIRENHNTIYTYLENIADRFNKEGIDYQLAGSLCGYLKYNSESSRIHDDIDFHLNERDIERVRRIVTDMGFDFFDKRLNSPRILKDGVPYGKHEVMATLKDKDFHVGFICFERLANGAIISKNYYHDENNNPCAREDIFGPTLTKEIYDSNVITLNNTQIKVTSPEFIFQIKHYSNKEKDSIDIKFLYEHIDTLKLQRIKELSKNEQHIQMVPVNDLPRAILLNPLAVENDNSELSQMLVTSNEKTEENYNNFNSNSKDNGKTKMLTKTNKKKNAKTDGYADYIIIVATFFSLMAIGLLTILIMNL